MTLHQFQSVFKLETEPKFESASSLGLSSIVGPSPFHCQWRHRIERRLNDIAHLKFGWDGHNGKLVNAVTLQFTIEILVGLMRPHIPEPSIGATSYGGIQIEWHRKGWDVEIEIVAPNRLEIFTRNVQTDQIEEFSLGIVLDRLSGAVDRIKD